MLPENADEYPDLAYFNGPLISGCFVCKTNFNLKKCKGCYLIMYCCVEHQKQDWPLHKVVCKMVKGAQQRFETADEALKSLASRDGTFRNLLAINTRSYCLLPQTQDFMDQLEDLVDVQISLKTVLAIKTGLESCWKLYNHDLIYPNDPTPERLFIRYILPIQMLRANEDQQCYDFLREPPHTYKTVYDFSAVRLPSFDKSPEQTLLGCIKDTDIFQAPVFVSENPSLRSLAIVFLLKLRLLLDVKFLRNCGELRAKLPTELVKEIHYYTVTDIIKKRKSEITTDNAKPLVHNLETQLELIYASIDRKNESFWPALMNPRRLCELQVMETGLEYVYPAYVETPGAMKTIEHRHKLGKGQWK